MCADQKVHPSTWTIMDSDTTLRALLNQKQSQKTISPLSLITALNQITALSQITARSLMMVRSLVKVVMAKSQEVKVMMAALNLQVETPYQQPRKNSRNTWNQKQSNCSVIHHSIHIW